MKSLKELTRANIWAMKPYASARNEYHGTASVFLDANENPYNSPHNRYPDPMQWELKQALARLKGVEPEQIFLGNGSDEAIDLPMRAFCRPGIDNVVAIEPTYGMYAVAAATNDVAYRKALLSPDFQLEADTVLKATDENTKLIFLCSPNNPTGNDLSHREIDTIIEKFEGLVILDEAYSDFSAKPSYLRKLKRYPNLIVLQTFSKAWGSAGIRLGMAFASPEIIALLSKIKYPYNINYLTQKQGLDMVFRAHEITTWVEAIKRERANLMKEIEHLPIVDKVYHSDANFFLARMARDAEDVYKYLIAAGIVVRNRSNVALCKDCLRITVGSRIENHLLLNALKSYP
ncbi:MAG: histidinol-phosphate transaminase [Prevotellaceae bacterium]|jgi:histidinol-phosphate aminotransferase|nr:histidinol-phosphate transaminase [Prevotellaceae bacterium]